MKPWVLLMSAGLSVGCEESTSEPNESGGSGGAPAAPDGGTGGGEVSNTGGRAAIPGGGPRYHPPKGFENCEHAPVKEDCADGWCVLPAGCFVAGTPPNESYRRGAFTEDQMAVTLTHNIEVQQTEMTRKQWRDITGVDTTPDPSLACLEDDCPVTQVTWWEALHVANLLSVQKGLKPCYEPKECTGKLGKGLVCKGFENSDDVVYECEGYRLLTRAEAEYAARAGTISSFYSGDITIQPDDSECYQDENLDKIAWYCHNSGKKTHPVAQLQANDFGLFDLLGNTYEWLNDMETWGSSPGGENPEGEIARPASKEAMSRRVLYGGRVNSHANSCKAAWRGSTPWDAYNKWSAYTGFRLARSLPAK